MGVVVEAEDVAAWEVGDRGMVEIGTTGHSSAGKRSIKQR
jgi:hypothetical protein